LSGAKRFSEARLQTNPLEVMVKHSILLHELEDDVGVAVIDLKAGTQAKAVTLHGQDCGNIKVSEDIPLGHKIAMHDIRKGESIIKYGRPIGKATQDISGGARVHVHNIKSMRW